MSNNVVQGDAARIFLIALIGVTCILYLLEVIRICHESLVAALSTVRAFEFTSEFGIYTLKEGNDRLCTRALRDLSVGQ